MQISKGYFIGCLFLVASGFVYAGKKHKQPVQKKSVQPFQQFLREDGKPLIFDQMVTSPDLLVSVAQDALYNTHHKFAHYVHSDLYKPYGITARQVQKTLAFIVETIKQDQQQNRPLRMNDPAFINEHFRLISWVGDAQTAKKNGVIKEAVFLAPENIRLTCYACFSTQGSSKKTDRYNCALYELLGTESEQDLFAKKFSKQQIIDGKVLEQAQYKKRVRPCVWVSREGLEDALMQGSIVVKMPDGNQRVFNVHKNNGIAYDKTIRIKQGYNQKRYWFFQEISARKGMDAEFRLRTLTQKGALVAGDVELLGAGKVIALKYQNPQTEKDDIRLVVLNDRGGAFEGNMYQLDLYLGIFDTRQAFKEEMIWMPDRVKAYILIKK